MKVVAKHAADAIPKALKGYGKAKKDGGR